MNELPKKEKSSIWWWVIGIIIIILAGGISFLYTANNNQPANADVSVSGSVSTKPTPSVTPSAITTTEIDASITKIDTNLQNLDATASIWDEQKTDEAEQGL